jgi:hypothetical protein
LARIRGGHERLVAAIIQAIYFPIASAPGRRLLAMQIDDPADALKKCREIR